MTKSVRVRVAWAVNEEGEAHVAGGRLKGGAYEKDGDLRLDVTGEFFDEDRVRAGFAEFDVPLPKPAETITDVTVEGADDAR